MKSLIKLITRIEVIVFVLSFITAIYLLIFAPAKYFIWHALPMPPEPVTEIIYATVDTIIIRTISNKGLSCNIYVEKECWVEGHYAPPTGIPLWCFPDDDSTEHTIQIAKACNLSHNFGIVGTIYSLNSDGVVYVKHKGYISLAGYYFSAIIGLFCAFSTFLGKRLLLSIWPGIRHDGA
jgi:hypothetical protein